MIIFRLRKIKKSDCEDILKWRNDPWVREWSFQKRKIKLANHRRWFEKFFKDKKFKGYIAEMSDGTKIGQVRFEQETRQLATIHINLNPKFFRRGLGPLIIRRATQAYRKSSPQIKVIQALILSKNLISKKAFERAGYIFLHDDILHGRKVDIYTCQAMS